MSVLFSLIIIMLLTAFPLKAALLEHTESLSRNHFYVAIDTDDTPYQHVFQVGGEHINHYYILGFEGDIFSVNVRGFDGQPDVYIGGDSVIHNEGTYQVVKQHTWLEIAISAHPYSEYLIEVHVHRE
ncbi:hypothetical protein LRP49_07055 [Enterovibrio sp. ZSDZ35]|uniref:Uncharacterized protein n=1 Tax=Enterovibrio qingdaonensis TaxID=2899818 RepID=A0ABT5QK27_9GAMM|nr:hypothetical protein [Enterovibrio sp. ZSDZ35]MDD1780959.1 hypothetical protein [Enterovibrio sp. ZSDZ35]